VEIGKRLKEERERVGRSQGEMADAMRVDRKSQASYESGQRSPRADYLSEAHGLGIDVLYVLTGVRQAPERAAGAADAGTPLIRSTSHVAESPAPWLVPAPVSPDRSPANGRSRRPDARALLPAEGVGASSLRPLVLTLAVEAGKVDYYVIPKVMGGAAAGLGEMPSSDVRWDQAGDFAFSADWLNEHLQHTSGELVSVRVIGDSMAPTLADSDCILIDRAVRTVDADGIYVLQLYQRRVVKRVQHLMDGSLVLISDNPAYDKEVIARDRARDVLVMGRMVWPRVR
jgi:transcriptional regulator with XRE-family HTH domain